MLGNVSENCAGDIENKPINTFLEVTTIFFFFVRFSPPQELGIVCLKSESDLAVLQVGVDVFDEGVVGVSSGEGQLAERTATDSALF